MGMCRELGIGYQNQHTEGYLDPHWKTPEYIAINPKVSCHRSRTATSCFGSRWRSINLYAPAGGCGEGEAVREIQRSEADGAGQGDREFDAEGLQRTEFARRTGIGIASVYRVLADAKKAAGNRKVAA
jgi:hypothetical protein